MRLAAVFFVAVLMCSAMMRYGLEVRVKDERAALAEVGREVALREREIGILRAEIAHLESPARLQAAAGAVEGLRPADPVQLTSAQTALARLGAPLNGPANNGQEVMLASSDPFAEFLAMLEQPQEPLYLPERATLSPFVIAAAWSETLE